MKNATRNHSQVAASAPVIATPKKGKKGAAAPVVATTDKVEKIAAPTVSPAERMANAIAKRIGKAAPSEGSRARQITHKENTVKPFARAAAGLGMTQDETFTAYTAPHTLDVMALGTLADEADRERAKDGLRSPYFRSRNFTKVAFNADAPAFTLAELTPTIRKGIADGFAAHADLNAAKA